MNLAFQTPRSSDLPAVQDGQTARPSTIGDAACCMVGYDIGVSLADSTAQQAARDVRLGDFIIGGSGGVNQVPAWVWIALVGVGVVALFMFLLRPKRR